MIQFLRIFQLLLQRAQRPFHRQCNLLITRQRRQRRPRPFQVLSLIHISRTRLTDEELFEMRRELELQLRPYRSKMTGDQLARLERSFLDRKVYEKAGLPRLSLFFMI